MYLNECAIIVALEYKIFELDGKTNINIKNKLKTNILETIEIWSMIVLFSSLIIGFLSNYFTIIIAIVIFSILIVIEFILIFYIITYRKTLTLLIDPINRSFTSNNRFTHVFDKETKLIQYYQNYKGEKFYGNLVFEIDGEKKIGSLGDGDANYYFGKKLNEILDIPYSTEIIQDKIRKKGKSDLFIIVQSIFLLFLSIVFLFSLLKP